MDFEKPVPKSFGVGCRLKTRHEGGAVYSVQCLNGHVFEAPRGSYLEQQCIQRAAKGYLDALAISAKECELCEEDRLECLRRESRIGC